MSSDGRTAYSRAREIAEGVVDALRPWCDRIEIAGSVRRQRPTVGDVEIVASPKLEPEPLDLFASVDLPCRGYQEAVSRWQALKGFPTGRYTQRLLPQGIKLDLFHATPRNWGLIMAIRTGSALWARYVLAQAWVSAGYHSHQGMLRRDGVEVATREERDLFELIGLPWVEPERREWEGA